MPNQPNKFYIGIKNEASTGVLELFFLDYIQDGFDWSTYEYKSMVSDTIAQIKAANPKKVCVVINSLGGDVMIGLAIYNYLKNSGIEVETENIGFAASIASVMLMSGSTRKMARNSFVIIHAASSGGYGNAKDLREAADALDKVSGQLADIYAQASGKEANYFTDAWANGDVWLTAQECLDLGLITEITNDVQVNASVDFSAYGLKNIPAALLQNAATAPATSEQTFFQKLENKMGKFLDMLTNAITGQRESKEPVALASKEDVLAFMEATLKPFAEAVDAALEEVKPAAAATEEVKDEKPAESKEEKPVETPAETVTLEAVLKEMKELKAQIANAGTKPAPANTNSDARLEGIRVEYE